MKNHYRHKELQDMGRPELLKLLRRGDWRLAFAKAEGGLAVRTGTRRGCPPPKFPSSEKLYNQIPFKSHTNQGEYRSFRRQNLISMRRV